jgi:hypothetical protein
VATKKCPRHLSASSRGATNDGALAPPSSKSSIHAEALQGVHRGGGRGLVGDRDPVLVLDEREREQGLERSDPDAGLDHSCTEQLWLRLKGLALLPHEVQSRRQD